MGYICGKWGNNGIIIPCLCFDRNGILGNLNFGNLSFGNEKVGLLIMGEVDGDEANGGIANAGCGASATGSFVSEWWRSRWGGARSRLLPLVVEGTADKTTSTIDKTIRKLFGKAMIERLERKKKNLIKLLPLVW